MIATINDMYGQWGSIHELVKHEIEKFTASQICDLSHITWKKNGDYF